MIEPKIIKNMRGAVEVLRYDHKNAEVGCSYRVETNAMITAEMKVLREDGSEVKL